MTESKKLEFPELAAALRSRKIGDFLKFFGPGAIIASVTIGSGETVWASRSGAIFGYAMFWAFSLFCITKVVQVYSAARYMTLTGEHPMERWAQLPGPKGIVPGGCRRGHGRKFSVLSLQPTHHARHDLVLDII